MDTLDWIIAVVFVILFGVAGYYLLTPWGVLPGAALAAFLVWRAKLNRDRLRQRNRR